MQAYLVYEKGNEEACSDIVFAKNARVARYMIYGTYLEPESFIDIRAVRAPDFDDCLFFSERDICHRKWKLGWWFDAGDLPDAETADDEEFFEWYFQNYERE